MPIPFEKPLDIHLSNAGAYSTAGIWVQPPDTDVTINATVLPEKNQEIIAELGGTNNRGIVTIRSESEIKAADEAAGTKGHTLDFDGRTYEVVKVNHYTDVFPHYKGWAKATDGKEGS